MDPRPAVLGERLSGVRRIVAVAGAKGGVGKSTVAAGLALGLAARGIPTGLLDLDFHGPSAHLILGAGQRFPVEDHGVIPPEVHGVRLMSIAYYAGDRPLPLRGPQVTDAMLEMLAITRWGNAECLVIDMPPGLGEATLEAIRLLPRTGYLLVTTPSELAVRTMTRLLVLLLGARAPVLGIVGNMFRPGSAGLAGRPGVAGAPLLGELPHDPDLEGALGDPARFRATTFARRLDIVVDGLAEGGFFAADS